MHACQWVLQRSRGRWPGAAAGRTWNTVSVCAASTQPMTCIACATTPAVHDGDTVHSQPSPRQGGLKFPCQMSSPSGRCCCAMRHKLTIDAAAHPYLRCVRVWGQDKATYHRARCVAAPCMHLPPCGVSSRDCKTSSKSPDHLRLQSTAYYKSMPCITSVHTYSLPFFICNNHAPPPSTLSHTGPA